jgi:hypothetical protein
VDIYITFERGGSKVSNITAIALALCTAVRQRQLRAKWIQCIIKFFALVNSLILSRRLRRSVRFVFISTLNLQRGRAFVVGIANFSKQANRLQLVQALRANDKRKRVEFCDHMLQNMEHV